MGDVFFIVKVNGGTEKSFCPVFGFYFEIFGFQITSKYHKTNDFMFLMLFNNIVHFCHKNLAIRGIFDVEYNGVTRFLFCALFGFQFWIFGFFGIKIQNWNPGIA